MARKAFVVTDAMREKVRYLAGVGVRQDDIAKIVGCAPKTLRKRLREDQGELAGASGAGRPNSGDPYRITSFKRGPGPARQ